MGLHVLVHTCDGGVAIGVDAGCFCVRGAHGVPLPASELIEYTYVRRSSVATNKKKLKNKILQNMNEILNLTRRATSRRLASPTAGHALRLRVAAVEALPEPECGTSSGTTGLPQV